MLYICRIVEWSLCSRRSKQSIIEEEMGILRKEETDQSHTAHKWQSWALNPPLVKPPSPATCSLVLRSNIREESWGRGEMAAMEVSVGVETVRAEGSLWMETVRQRQEEALSLWALSSGGGDAEERLGMNQVRRAPRNPEEDFFDREKSQQCL